MEAPEIRGLCCRCNKNLQKKKSNGNYRTLCSSCEKALYQSEQSKLKENKRAKTKDYSYRRVKTNICSMCDFTSIYPCQFDVDHINGNHQNNNTSNLQTLCANCHRLKTLLNGEGIYSFH